jgi:tetratricopeptide (TPR) repeat protein
MICRSPTSGNLPVLLLVKLSRVSCYYRTVSLFARLSGFFDAFSLARTGNGLTAATLLREEFEMMRASPQRVELCEWIAHCFYQLGQFEEAGSWFETAGQLLLSEPTTPVEVKALNAVGEYEKALECYQHASDEDAVTECSTMLHEIRRACASA